MSVDYRIPAIVVADSVTPNFTNIDNVTDRERCTGFACTVSYLNGTSMVLSITDRTGLAINLKPSQVVNTGDFCIYVNYKLGPNASINPHSLVNEIESDLPEELKAIRICLMKNNILERRLNDSMVNFEIVYKIPASLIRDHNGAVHLEQLGLSISIPKENTIVLTPDSELAKIKLLGQIPDIPGFSYRVEINDPEKTYGGRYANIAGRVFKVDITNDKSKREGVYVYTTAPEMKSDGSFKNRYDFHEADEKLHLYKTYEDALNYGDQAAEREKEYERAKHELKMEQIEGERGKNDQTQQQLFFKTILDRFTAMEDASRKHAEHLTEMSKKHTEEREEERRKRDKEEQQRKQEEREERAQERRERLEYLKWMTAAATAVTAAIIALSKLTSNNKQ